MTRQHLAVIDDDTVSGGHDREVLVELVRLHANVLRRMPWVQAVLGIGVGLVVVGPISLAVFTAWFAISVSVESLRAFAARQVLRNLAVVDPKRAHSTFVVLALVAGAVIGVGAMLCLPRVPVADQAVLAIILFTMAVTGVAVAHSSRYIIAAYSFSILLPSTATWMWIHPHQALSVGLLTLLFCGLIILLASQGEQLLLRSVMIRHQRDRLIRDLEQRNADVRRAVERAEQAAQSRARVLATASHDLRQPLHALSIFSAVLAAGPEPAQLREVSASIDQIVRSLGSLLHGLLDLSRLTVGHYQAEHEPVALDSVIATVCAEYQNAASDKGLALRISSVPINLTSDAVAIGRIVRNLLDNAIKFTDRGAIEVTVTAIDDRRSVRAVIIVSDSGRGIPLAEQAHVFEEFYQLDNRGRDRESGVGLGLAIVKRLCELIGAEIIMESAPNTGTTFRVMLPGEPVDSGPLPASGTVATSPVLTGHLVYLVDNESDILLGMEQLLSAWGMVVATATSASAAERLFHDCGKPDLLITDLRLHGAESGAELAYRLHEAYSDFPVLVITGEVSTLAVRQVESLGATLLYKPTTPELLRRAIVAAIAASAS